ncbi:Polar-differentiation response regulator DivK [compost metagenome]
MIHPDHRPDDTTSPIGLLAQQGTEADRHSQTRAEHALLRSIIDSSRAPIFAKDLNGRFLLANRACQELFGRSEEQLTGRHSAELLDDPRLVEHCEAWDRRVIQSGQVESLRLVPSTGQRFDLAKSPLYDAEGNVRGVVGFAQPLAEANDAPQAAAPLPQFNLDLSRAIVPQPDSAHVPPAPVELPVEPARSCATPPFRVLYIEDNPASQRLLANLFGKLPGFSLQCADSAEDGIELACIERPDLILMDINLPSLNGYQALGILSREPSTQAIPVIALTADAMLNDIRRGEEAGFQAYLTKPLDLNRLIDLLQERAQQKH